MNLYPFSVEKEEEKNTRQEAKTAEHTLKNEELSLFCYENNGKFYLKIVFSL